jgi:dipeptidyl aminopeptidase/acylaminoacyl peptidase
VSPLEYVRRDLPPILTIHGDRDVTVPYSHAVRLHEALEAAGAKHELHTVPGGAHGGFTREETVRIWETIHRFLGEHGITADGQ